MRKDTPYKSRVENARKSARKRDVVFTQDSRASGGVDAMWSAFAAVGRSVIFPTKVAADFVVPTGKSGKLISIWWSDSPPVFCNDDDDVGLTLYLNGASSLNFRRSINGNQPTFSNTQFSSGFLQGMFIPTFLRVDEGDVITIEVFTLTVVFTSVRMKAQFSLSDNNTGEPIEGQLTNK